MRICGFAGEGLKGGRDISETLPIKELQDYWFNHPRYEDERSLATGSGSAEGSTTTNINVSEGFTGESGQGEEPPPPYVSEDSVLVPTEKVCHSLCKLKQRWLTVS